MRIAAQPPPLAIVILIISPLLTVTSSVLKSEAWTLAFIPSLKTSILYFGVFRKSSFTSTVRAFQSVNPAKYQFLPFLRAITSCSPILAVIALVSSQVVGMREIKEANSGAP